MKKNQHSLTSVFGVFIASILISNAANSQGVVAQRPILTPGDTFVYERGNNADLTFKFIKRNDETLVFKMATAYGAQEYYTNLDLATVGLEDGSTYKPNSGILRFPLRVGARWEQEYDVQKASGNWASRVRSCEVKNYSSVTVPAGTFDAFFVECTNRAGSSDRTEHHYYAPKIGNRVLYKNLGSGTKWTLKEYASGK